MPRDLLDFCIYDAASPEAIRKVAGRNGLPGGRITQLSVLDPYAQGARGTTPKRGRTASLLTPY